MLRNWRMLAVVCVVVVLALFTGNRPSVLRFIALGMVGTGVGLNLFVIVANGGRMPAHTDTIPPDQNHDYALMNSGTRFAYLGDWIQVREWLISPGDVCLYVGLVMALIDRWIGRYWF